MKAEIIDAAMNIGRHAASRMSVREAPTDWDREEIHLQAGDQLTLTLERLGYTDPAILDEAMAIMVDEYMKRLDKLTGGKGSA